MKVNITQLNNKSRKGTYIYIKQPKKKGSYYKFNEEIPIDAYVEYYKDKNNINKRKKKGTLKQYKKAYTNKPIKKAHKLKSQAKKYQEKIAKQPKINDVINTGISESTIKDGHQTNNDEIKYAKQKLLKNLVLDKELLNILIKHENFKKIQNRLEYRITFKDHKNEIIGTTSIFNKQPEEVMQKLQKAIKKGELISEDSKSQAIQKLKFYNFVNINIKKTAKLQRAEIKLIFRKGK